ncbi:potassium channel family protein [Metabacillus lacus]|nr:potassium channel protein [Metabacillus lacus]
MRSNKLMIDWLKWPIFVRFGIIGILIILVFGEIISIMEPDEFTTRFDGIWWAIVTISTVGFGDYVPQTVLGRLTGILLILLGVSFITAYFATLSAAAIQKQQDFAAGKMTFKQKEHIIIVGWSQKTLEMIQTIRKLKPYKQIVLIDQTLEEAPLIENVYFVSGNPIEDEVLLKANISLADSVIITANQHKSEMDADMLSIMVLLAVKGLNAGIYVIIEVLTEQQSQNAKRAGADEIIKTYQLASQSLMSCYLSKKGLACVYEELNPAAGNLYRILPVLQEWDGKTFLELHTFYIRKEIILIGIKKGDETEINPPISRTVQLGDELIVLSH